MVYPNHKANNKIDYKMKGFLFGFHYTLKCKSEKINIKKKLVG